MCSIWWDLMRKKIPVEQYAELRECDDETLSARTHQPISVPPTSTNLDDSVT